MFKGIEVKITADVPDDKIFLLPREVSEAIEASASAVGEAGAFAALSYLGPAFAGIPWLLVAADINRVAEEKAIKAERLHANALHQIALHSKECAMITNVKN